MSDTRFCDSVSYIVADDKKIESCKQMKILGFIFEERPTVEAHISYCITKFNRALWSLTHLRRAKISDGIMLEVFKVMLRPLLEYCSAVYDPMLTIELENNLERQQRRALQIIYGFGISYSELLERTGLETLKVRRQKACLDFAVKLAESQRFAELFPRTEYTEDMPTTRNRKQYVEKFARTSRLYNSPLYTMRRHLNTII